MKRTGFTLLLVCCIQAGYAQRLLKRDVPRGTWVIESNISSPKDQVIKFYNSGLDLIYEESVTNRRIRYEKERVKKALNRTLEIALRNDKKTEPGTFAMVLKRNRF